MKKLLVVLTALCLMIPAVNAAGNKNSEKAIKKEMKAKMKEFNKEGWKIFGTTHTLEYSLMKHLQTLDQLGEGAREFVGFATNFKSKNIGKQMAANSVYVSYGQQAGSTLKGRVLVDMNANGTEFGGEFENFQALYERLVEKEIKDVLKESFTLIRSNPDGTFEMQSFYIADEDGAGRARMRAYETARKESSISQQNADKIAEFVRQGLEGN